jgi:hypothetical protein
MRGQISKRARRIERAFEEGDMKFSSLAVGGLILLSALPAFTTGRKPVAAAPASGYSHDAKGLEAEYQIVLDAINKGQAPPYDKELADLTIPDPAGWFGQYFEPADVPGVVKEYEALVARDQKSLIYMVTEFFPAGAHFKVRCKPYPPNAAKFPPRDDAYKPKTAVPIEQFEVMFESNKAGKNGGGHTMSSMSNFAWIDGAYRHLGNGAYPFWSMPTPAQIRSLNK